MIFWDSRSATIPRLDDPKRIQGMCNLLAQGFADSELHSNQCGYSNSRVCTVREVTRDANVIKLKFARLVKLRRPQDYPTCSCHPNTNYRNLPSCLEQLIRSAMLNRRKAAHAGAEALKANTSVNSGGFVRIPHTRRSSRHFGGIESCPKR